MLSCLIRKNSSKEEFIDEIIKEWKGVNGGALMFMMLLSLIVSVGFPGKVYAVEGRATAMDYFIMKW